jgi:hypothetical protein
MHEKRVKFPNSFLFAGTTDYKHNQALISGPPSAPSPTGFSPLFSDILNVACRTHLTEELKLSKGKRVWIVAFLCYRVPLS